MRSTLSILACSLALLTQPLAGQQPAPRPIPDASVLVLRAGVAPIERGSTIVTVDARGVELESAGTRRWLSWDLVRVPPDQPALAPFARLSEDAWRARSRLARGDVQGAEPLFEQLFQQVRGTTGATPAMVASGLLRCRLHRGAQHASVEAWLALLATGLAAPAMPVVREDAQAIWPASVMDEQLLLCPSLPPLWPAGSMVRGDAGAMLSQDVTATDAREQRRREIAAALRTLYDAAGRAASGAGVVLPARPAGDAGPDYAGVRLVWDIVASTAGDATQRREAMQHLEDLLRQIENDANSLPGWIEAWSRCALGRARMRSSDPEERALGIATSLAVPALLADDNRFVAGLCLADVAQTRLREGDGGRARALRDELRLLVPTHPALTLLDTQLAQDATQSASKAMPAPEQQP